MFKISNPIKTIIGSADRIIKNPTNTAAWGDLALGGATGGWVGTGAAEREKKLLALEKQAKKNEKGAYRQQIRDLQAKQLIETGKPIGSVLSGTEAEQKGQLAGLNLGATAYGQGLGQTGKDVQSVLQQMKARAAQSGGDPVTAAIMGQKQAALAQARRNLSGTGVRGAAAAGALESIGRQQDQQIAASLYGQQRQSIQDLRNILGNIISGTTGLMQGEKAANVAQPELPKEQEGFLSNLWQYFLR